MGVARRWWRRLTSMRTALLLLFLLALAAVPGSFLPQRGLNADQVAAYYKAHPAIAPLLNRLSLFDVFAAPWFAAIYLLLFVSLVGCIVPRTRLHLRALRSRPPKPPRYLTRLTVHAAGTLPGEPADVVAAAATALRRRRFRVDVHVEDGGAALSAEKGYLRETGNLVFHVALIVLLVAIALGGLLGYKGSVLVVEGNGFSNTLIDYDQFSPGRMFSPSKMAPFTVNLRSFAATYLASGEPSTFKAIIDHRPSPTSPYTTSPLTVNAPLTIDGAQVYLIGHGYAPVVTVRGPDGRIAFQGPVPFLPQDTAFTSLGVIKVPDISPGRDGRARQLGFSGFFTPTTGLGPNGFTSVFPAPRNPQLTLLAWVGDLGLDAGTAQSVYTLDPSGMTKLSTFTIRPGQTVVLPHGAGTITFTGLRQWVSFQVTYDPGKYLALIAAVAMVVGLVLSLRIRRRRVWVRGRADGSGGTVVEMGGLARTDADGFEDEFMSLASLVGIKEEV